MASPPLPISVEELLERIRTEKLTEAADYRARAELQRIDEAQALNILWRISRSPKINNLSSYIHFMIKKYCTANMQPVEVGTKCLSEESVNFSGPSSLNLAATDDDLRNASMGSGSLYIHTREQHQTIEPLCEQMNVTLPPNQKPSLVIEALGMLEFRKAFLILSYVGSQKLDEIISTDSIFKLRWLPMVTFERELWNIVKGKACLSESDRRKNFDWESKNYFVYHCHVDLSGNTCFKGPYLQDITTHLHRTFGDDNVLNVKFAIGGDDCVDLFYTYHKIAEEGIKLGLRTYRFFVYKDNGKEKKKSPNINCYFVRTESNWAMDTNTPYVLADKSIEKARSMFMHVHTVSSVAKYMLRFSLILSKTMNLEINFASLKFRIIEDTPCLDAHGQVVYDEDGKLLIHTDGTGLVSEDIARKCPKRVFKGRDMKPKYFEKFLCGLDRGSSVRDILSVADEPPLLLQIRLFYNGYAVKGTLLVDKRLPADTICVRPSMIKVEPDPSLPKQHCNSLEVCGTSNLPRRTCLSKNIIALLHYGGVSKDFFMDLTTQEINNAMDARLSKKSALKVAVHHGNMDDYLLARMILCGIPLDEPYLQSRLLILMRQELNNMKNGKIPITESYNLMGTTDPSGNLGPNEVCIILENGQISGDVLVFKHPGLHFGDIHVLKAVFIKDIESIVGNCKFAIIFPTKGPRSLADEMANSDFDGDIYWVSKNPQLIQSFKPSVPWKWTYPKPKSSQQKKPTDLSNAELERVLFHRFLKGGFSPSYAMSEASNSWMAYMDRLLTPAPAVREMEKPCLEEKIRKLVDIYYIALDASKDDTKVEVQGNLKASKYPHFMETTKPTYKSSSVLGLIYDKVDSFQIDDYSLHEINTLPCMSEPAPLHCLDKWSKRFDDYRSEMTHALQANDDSRSSAADQVIQKYKQMLYEEEDFEKSRRKEEDILDEALAIYQIVYNHVNSSVTKKGTSCGFAWKVAGHALCRLHAKMQTNDTTFICLKSVLQEAL